MLRVGVIGLRFGAQVHVPAFRLDPRAGVSALAGRDAARTAAAAAALGIPRAYGDWRVLLDDAAIDAVTIAVPPAEQGAIVMEAARRGTHVFCEKPLAESLGAAERIVDAVNRAGVVHAIDFMFPELPTWQRARAMLREGAIGRPRHFSYAWRVETYTSRTNADSWKNRPADGGGAVGNFLSHVVFNVEWFLGPVVRLEPVSRTWDARAAAFFDGLASTAEGTHGTIAVSTDAFLGLGHHIEIFGESGTLVLRNGTSDYADGFELHVGTRESGALHLVQREAAQPAVDGRIAAVGRIARRFLDGVEQGLAVSPNLDDGLRVQRWLHRCAGC